MVVALESEYVADPSPRGLPNKPKAAHNRKKLSFYIHKKLAIQSKIQSAAFAHNMQDVFRAKSATLPTIFEPRLILESLPPSRGSAVSPVALFEAWDDLSILQPARQKLFDEYWSNAIVKMKTPAPEHHILDALHIRPLEGSRGPDRAVIRCAGANGHYEDDFTSTTFDDDSLAENARRLAAMERVKRTRNKTALSG